MLGGMTVPSEYLIEKEMERTGFSRLICIRRIQARQQLML